jgi:hypothetical protein
MAYISQWMNDPMGRVSCTLIVVALAAVLATSSAAAQDAQAPPPPVSDPTLPLTMEPAAGRPLDLPVATSLRQEAQPEQQERFKPLDDLPPGEQLPAGPLLVAAYASVMLAFFAYLLSVARRLGSVQREVERLERDIKKSGRA